jgi:hypothetical protein
MYSNYISSIKNIITNNINTISFKNNVEYNGILEHVSKKQGEQYLSYIITEFPEISTNQILEFVNSNDLYGNPKRYDFKLNNDIINCSPTSLRYIYHALIILQYYKNTKCASIVEVGCGYGGLFLALCFFSNALNIKIMNYHIVDLPEVGLLIDMYLKLHINSINIPYSIHDSKFFGSDILSENLFFISNYCFTEIDLNLRNKYIDNLISKTQNGFITWQTIFDKIQIENIFFNKKIKNIIEEKPQTATNEYKNYFVHY